MINLHESIGPGRDRTPDPGSAARLASVARHVTDGATRPGIIKLWLYTNVHGEIHHTLSLVYSQG